MNSIIPKKKILMVLSKSYQHEEGGNITCDQDKKKLSVQTIMQLKAILRHYAGHQR